MRTQVRKLCTISRLLINGPCGFKQPKGGAKIVKVCGGREFNPLSRRETVRGGWRCLLSDLAHFRGNYWVQQ